MDRIPASASALVEVQAHPEVVNEVGGHHHGNAQRKEDGHHCGKEVVSPQTGHKAGNVDLVQSNQEEEDEHTQGQEEMNVSCGVDRPQSQGIQYRTK